MTEKDLLSKDRIKLPYRFDVGRMMTEIHILGLKEFEYYDVIPLTLPRRKDSPGIPVNYADGSWADWQDSTILRQSEYLREIVQTFRDNTQVTLVRLLRLSPGSVIDEHRDPTLGLQVTDSVIRITIPIISDNKVTFLLNGSPVPMTPGECWYLRLTDPHRIVNGSDEVRVNMSIDVIPNEWLKDQLIRSSKH